jgi:hypothetical protein
VGGKLDGSLQYKSPPKSAAQAGDSEGRALSPAHAIAKSLRGCVERGSWETDRGGHVSARTTVDDIGIAGFAGVKIS